MNISAYLPDKLIAAVDRLARDARTSRSALIREAIELYLRRRERGAWPDAVQQWPGDAEFPPFESGRGTAEHETRDPFARMPRR